MRKKTTFHQYQKLYSTPPSLGAHTCKVSRKYSNAFLSYSAKTKRDGRTDRQTDGQTDRRTGGGAISPVPGPTAPAGDKNYTAHPMTWCTYLQSFEKIHQCVFELQCEN